MAACPLVLPMIPDTSHLPDCRSLKWYRLRDQHHNHYKRQPFWVWLRIAIALWLLRQSKGQFTLAQRQELRGL